MKNIKIALVNNMNNSFFSFQRYLLDKGLCVDYAQIDDLDDHFLPEADSFFKDEFNNFIDLRVKIRIA